MVILYADDDPEDHEVFAEIIKNISPEIRILRASNGQTAMELLSAEGPPDVIFLDVNMPVLNGFQALTEIRKNEKFQHIQVIMYSTNSYQASLGDLAFMKAKYIRKPNTIREGVEALRALLNTPNTNLT